MSKDKSVPYNQTLSYKIGQLINIISLSTPLIVIIGLIIWGIVELIKYIIKKRKQEKFNQDGLFPKFLKKNNSSIKYI